MSRDLPADPVAAPHPPASAAHSRFVQRVRRRYEAELPRLAPGVPADASIAALIDGLRGDGRGLAEALRVARHLVLERLAVEDVERGATLADVTGAMTSLAEISLDLALAATRAELDARHGPPLTADGRPIDFWVVGMGKLGARELNVSSDIDLVYVYEEDGETAGPRPLSAHEYFALVAKGLYALIGETTDDGAVFRVDLMLRPNGNSGPTAVSLAMLEEYFMVQGREWERFAWLKSRVVAPRASVASGTTLALRQTVAPFVYRRYLDYGVFEGLRQLHRKVRDEAQRRAAGRPERANDVKLSRGGIREIEFIVQLFLVVRGGQYPEMRTRSTLKALGRLAAGGLMTAVSATRLADAYIFLRRVEHRIQYLDDRQTHLLPSDDADLDWIAHSLGLGAGAEPGRGAAQLLDLLGAAREVVAQEFDELLHEGRSPPSGTPACRTCVAPAPVLDSEAFVASLPEALAERVRPWIDHPKINALRDDSKLRLARLVTRAARAIEAGECTLAAALHFIDWLEPLLRRESYLALLAERPQVQRRLLRLLGLARWPMRYLMRHPGVIDELADEGAFGERFDAQSYLRDLAARHAAWERSGQADEELLLDTLRRAHHAEVFRTLMRDVDGRLSVEDVADDLTALADATLECAVAWAWQHLKNAHREAPRFGVIAYGKLGGKELGYRSDLDVVFVYDLEGEDDPDRATVVYSAFVRKLIPWLTLGTAAGELFDIDTALRPNGNSGPLVTSMSSYEKYQLGRGNNTAWTWEHQALTRARFCAGLRELEERFEAVRRAVIAAPRDALALRGEIVAMRRRVAESRPVPKGVFDVKHSPGGMMDVEFAVQHLVLAHGADKPELLDNVGNIALLRRAEACGLLPAGAGAAASDAYRELRRVQHRARLDEQPTQVAPGLLAREREAILAVWRAVFGDAG